MVRPSWKKTAGGEKRDVGGGNGRDAEGTAYQEAKIRGKGGISEFADA
jgi:hypothetical protein